MGRPVIHHPQVAWDAARAFVRAAGAPGYEAFADRILSRLGADLYGELANTRQRLLACSVENSDVEAGKWRVRLEDLLRGRPDLTTALRELTEAAPR